MGHMKEKSIGIGDEAKEAKVRWDNMYEDALMWFGGGFHDHDERRCKNYIEGLGCTCANKHGFVLYLKIKEFK